MIEVNLDSKYRDAMNYAFRKYVYLKREVSFLPYAIHSIRIISILREFGYNEFEHEDLMISVLLHDVIEDTPTKILEEYIATISTGAAVHISIVGSPKRLVS